MKERKKKEKKRLKEQWAGRTAGGHITGILLFRTVVALERGAASANIAATAGLTLDTSHTER